MATFESTQPYNHKLVREAVNSRISKMVHARMSPRQTSMRTFCISLIYDRMVPVFGLWWVEKNQEARAGWTVTRGRSPQIYSTST